MNFIKYLASLIIVLLISFNSEAQNKINWMTIEQAYTQMQVKPKKTIIDVYTSWCGWCKVMDKETFTDPAVVKYINENYYPVKLDAESTKSITLGTNKYEYDASKRSNKIAFDLLGGKMSYPSIVYLDENFNMIQPVPGYMDAKAFHQIITYFGGDFHKKEQYDSYKQGTYKSTFGKK